MIADILFGEISPSGKLPVTFYRDTEELPDFEDYSMKGRTYRYFTGTPLYPFGYGLTYSDVTLDSVDCCGRNVTGQSTEEQSAHERTGQSAEEQSTHDHAGQSVEVQAAYSRDGEAAFDLTATVSNRGAAATDEVIQVYIKAEDSVHATPAPRLCGFARVSLQPGETKRVKVPVDRDAFTVVNEEGERLVDGTRFTVSTGFGQPDARTRELTGKECILTRITLDI